jgi:hypothetical protein
MRFRSHCSSLAAVIASIWQIGFSGAPPLAAQTPAAGKPQPDVLILIDDERLVGHLVSADATSVSFKSDLLGDVKADWSKVKELHTQGQYAVVGKGVQLRPHANVSNVPQGTLNATAQTITITSSAGAPQTLPVAQAAQVLEETTFQKEVSPPPVPFTQAWTGAITAGGTLVEATQQTVSFTGAVHLVRAIPVETDFPPENRTIFDFSGTEGHETQPGTPEIKTEIAHADAERDQYFTQSRVYAFAEVAVDHNFSQGLTLQQNYGGGIGWTVIRQADETLDIKGSVDYERQQFTTGPNQDLIGSNFSENFMRKLKGGVTITEQFTVMPAWNVTNAWTATGNAALNVPVYKNLSFTLGVVDSYLNNPPPAFKKNSFTATTGLTYTVK